MQIRSAAGAVRVASAVVAVAGALSSACGGPEPPRQAFVFEGPTMGTAYQVKVVRAVLPEVRRGELDDAIRGELERINSLMSTYLDDSELSRFNRHGTTPFELADATWEVFETALEISRATGGALDVTVGPLVDAWGFGPGRSSPDTVVPELPEEELTAIRERIGWQHLELLDAPRAVRKARADLYCDLSSVAKGYAVDRVAALLAGLGETDFMVEVGGELRAAGRNDRGAVWRIGVERPQLARGRLQRVVPVADLALATSGDYRNYREIDGVRVSHIMDPRNGRPVRHRLASVTVVHASCAMADGLATALMVLGPDEGRALAEREGWAALFLVRNGEGFAEIMTPAFESLLGQEAETSAAP